jgi:hypothetical protein
MSCHAHHQIHMLWLRVLVHVRNLQLSNRCPWTMRTMSAWPARHAPPAMCMQAWRCAVVAGLLDVISDIYLIVVRPRIMHAPEYYLGIPSLVIWVLVLLVSFLLHTAGCAWVMHNTMHLNRLLFPSVFWRSHHFPARLFWYDGIWDKPLRGLDTWTLVSRNVTPSFAAASAA